MIKFTRPHSKFDWTRLIRQDRRFIVMRDLNHSPHGRRGRRTERRVSPRPVPPKTIIIIVFGKDILFITSVSVLILIISVITLIIKIVFVGVLFLIGLFLKVRI